MEERSMDDFFDSELQAFFDNPFLEDNTEDYSDSRAGESLAFWDAAPVLPVDGFDQDPIEDALRFGADEPLDENPPDSSSSSPFSSCAPQERSRSSSPTSPPSTIEVQIPCSTLLTPRSHYEPFDPGFPIKSEYEAIQELLPLAREQDKTGGEYLELQLDAFAIYDKTAHYGLQMRPLHQLDTKERGGRFYFDGVVRSGSRAFFVKGIAIQAMPIQNYGTPAEQHTVRDSIWLETPLSSRYDLYYRLGKPAPEYSRFFQPFLWVADLAKHFVDYLNAMWQEERQRVSIHDFRLNFYTWLRQTHGDAKEVGKWLSMHPSMDFRTSIVANIDFLYKEAIGVMGSKDTFAHLLWKDLSWDNAKFQRYKEQLHSPPLDHSRTVVTQYTFDCFKHLPFGDRLDAVPFSDKTQALREKLIQESFQNSGGKERRALSATTEDRIRNIAPGDTISTHRDTEESGSKWQRELSKDFSDVDRWFARVQKVNVNKNGKRCFDVSWYYRPVDTLCGLMKYPWKNELFLSDHCSCEERYKITEDEVLGVHDVDFNGNPSTGSEFFCRQAYIHQDRKWVSLEEKHLVCEHAHDRTEGAPSYRPGDTVLVRLDQSDRSQPCEVSSIAEARDNRGRLQRTLTVRKLLRRSKVDTKAQGVRPNELVYSDETVLVKEKRVMGRCYVRFFPVGTPISRPYDRNGVGHLFVLTHKIVSSSESTEPLKECPESLRQGFDPVMHDLPQLRGLDLFCGGGNFGRGLEEAGGIKMHWANDYVSNAIHTYMANVKAPEDVHPFLGSIDILQKLALEGNFSSQRVPAPGEVDFISGGSPCPGFSALTNDKTTVAQRKNQSLVAAFASMVDLYRPKYGLLENVTGIVQKKANRDQDVFSQLICAVVGLGYQAQFYFLDASSCGSPQRRSRVFLAFAAPRYKLPDKPQPTHSHPDYTKQLALGKLPNGEAMAEREWTEATPFKFVSAEEATADLPPIQDGKPDICIPFPDHRVSIGQTRKLLLQMSHIPNRPFGLNFATTWYRPVPLMTRSERDSFFPADNNATVLRAGPKSNAFGRQRPDNLIETVVTRQSPGDGKSGRQVHWHENRALTLMEARRAQGFRDEDVLLGTLAEQYRIVGNSVAREVAVALGIAFREAYAASMPVHPVGTKRVPVVLVKSNTDMDMDMDMDMDADTETASRVLTSTRENSRSETPLTSASEANSFLPKRIVPVVARKRKLVDTVTTSVVRSSKVTRIIMGSDSSGI